MCVFFGKHQNHHCYHHHQQAAPAGLIHINEYGEMKKKANVHAHKRLIDFDSSPLEYVCFHQIFGSTKPSIHHISTIV